VNLRWQQAMAPFFAPLEGLLAGERFPMLEEVSICRNVRGAVWTRQCDELRRGTESQT